MWDDEAPIKRPLSREKAISKGTEVSFVSIPDHINMSGIWVKALSSRFAIADFFGYRYQPLLYQAPMRIKVVLNLYRTGEKEQSTDFADIGKRFFLLVRAGTPVCFGRPRKPSVPCRVQKGVTISWLDDQLRYGSRPGQQGKG